MIIKGKEGWKEIFLKQISDKYGEKRIIKAENSKYILLGLPFVNEDNNTKFVSEYSNLAKM